jgi:hypothetical protein
MRGISRLEAKRWPLRMVLALAALLLMGLVPTLAAAAPVTEATIHSEITTTCGMQPLFPKAEALCVFKVKNLDAETPAPTGVLELDAAEGSIPVNCKLTSFGSSLSLCFAEYVAPAASRGDTITARYLGDEAHLFSEAKLPIALTATATSVTCSPEALTVGESSTCTARVENTGAGPNGFSGTVLFASSNEAQFTPNSCTVESTAVGSGTCSVKFTPKIGSTHAVTATYGGDATHPASHGSASINVRGTSVKLNCGPESVAAGEGRAVCTARVLNEGFGSKSLTGTVSFESGSEGVFSPVKCTLLPLPENAGGLCFTSYFPGVGGPHVIRATYSGDSTHPPANDGKGLVTATTRPTSSTFACTPASPIVETSATCTARVHDDSAQPTAPTGSVAFASDLIPREFSPASCILVSLNSAESSCSVVYTPATTATQLLSVAYGGDKTHSPSGSSKRLVRRTSANVSCVAAATVGSAINCTAIVHDVEADPTVPVGDIRFISSSTGTFASPSCTMVPFGSDAGICFVSYVPEVRGIHTITAIYDIQDDDDPFHGGSIATTDVRAITE